MSVLRTLSAQPTLPPRPPSSPGHPSSIFAFSHRGETCSNCRAAVMGGSSPSLSSQLLPLSQAAPTARHADHQPCSGTVVTASPLERALRAQTDGVTRPASAKATSQHGQAPLGLAVYRTGVEFFGTSTLTHPCHPRSASRISPPLDIGPENGVRSGKATARLLDY